MVYVASVSGVLLYAYFEPRDRSNRVTSLPAALYTLDLLPIARGVKRFALLVQRNFALLRISSFSRFERSGDPMEPDQEQHLKTPVRSTAYRTAFHESEIGELIR